MKETKDLTTIRIYFENGQKIKHQSFWKGLFSSDFSAELLKRAKAFDLKQVIHLHVSKGYFDNQKINWGVTETQHYKHPHIIEIIDSEAKINQFLEKQKDFLHECKTLIVKNVVVIR